MDSDVTLDHVPRRELAVVTQRTPMDRMPQVVPAALQEVAGYLAAQGLPFDGPAVAVYSDMNAGSCTVAAGFVVQQPFEGDGRVHHTVLPETDAYTLTHVGPYADVGPAYEAIQRAAVEQGRPLASLMWEEYRDPPDVPPEQTRTVICWPVAADAG